MINIETGQVIATKLAIESFIIVGGNPEEYIAEALFFLYNQYTNSDNEKCLNAIICLLLACREMGIILAPANSRLKEIFSIINYSEEKFFGGGTVIGRIMCNNTSEIRSILGYWPQGVGEEWNGEKVAKDIREKLKSKIIGQHIYSKNEGRGMFILNIFPTVAYLINIEKKRIYTLLLEEETIND